MAKRADYYHDENRRVVHNRPRGGGRALFLWVMDLLMLVVSVVAALALIAGLLSKVIDPRSVALFAFAGLFYQVIFVVNVACALWWVVRWKRWFALSAVVLLLGAGSIGLFYRSDMSNKEPEVERAREDVKIASYNVMNFSDTHTPAGENNYDRVMEWLNEEGVQIVCLQEAHFSSSRSFAGFKDGLKRMGYGFFTHSHTDKAGSQTGSGYTILSAYPIVRHDVVFASKEVKGVWADVKIARDTVRVYNLHLQSTGITHEERNDTLSPQIIDDTLARAKLSKVVGKMVENYRARAEQAEAVAEHIDRSPYPTIVCGDFNDTPMSYTYGTIADSDFADSYVVRGRGSEHTFKGLYNLFRIDYILAEEDDFEIKSYRSYDKDYSDHKAVVVTITPLNR